MDCDDDVEGTLALFVLSPETLRERRRVVGGDGKDEDAADVVGDDRLDPAVGLRLAYAKVSKSCTNRFLTLTDGLGWGQYRQQADL